MSVEHTTGATGVDPALWTETICESDYDLTDLQARKDAELDAAIAQLKAAIDDEDFKFGPSGEELLECLERCQDEIADQQATIKELKAKVKELTAAEDVAIWGEYTQGTITDLQAKVDELTGLNSLLLKEHVMGGKISRHTSNKTWKNWVEACREVEEALSQEGE